MDKIDEILTRGVENIYPSKEALKKKVLSGKKMKVYIGIDPTDPNLHLGHAIALRKLRQFQDLGNEAILLIGDFTGMIGDPTGKNATRVQLTREQVLENSKGYKKQISNILDFDGKNPAKIKYNSEWLDSLTYKEIIKIAAHLTASQMFNRDMFQKRLESGGEVGFHELMYPMMQGYDSVTMDVDMEIGGNDQMFNMLVGRDLMKKMKNKEKFVLTTKLLIDPAGKKMGKTEGNMITLRDSADDMFGKIMSWSDELIILGFELCTGVKMKDIEEVCKENPRDAKLRLAYEVVQLYHGEKEAERARDNFIKLFSKREIPKDIEEIKAKKDEELEKILVGNKIVSSNSEFRRLVRAGAIDINGKALQDSKFKVRENIAVKVGKKKFLKIISK